MKPAIATPDKILNPTSEHVTLVSDPLACRIVGYRPNSSPHEDVRLRGDIGWIVDHIVNIDNVFSPAIRT